MAASMQVAGELRTVVGNEVVAHKHRPSQWRSCVASSKPFQDGLPLVGEPVGGGDGFRHHLRSNGTDVCVRDGGHLEQTCSGCRGGAGGGASSGAAARACAG